MADYSTEAEQALKEVRAVGDKVRGKNTNEATVAIIIAATKEVAKIIDPTSAVGRILLGTILEDTAWKLGNGHPAFERLREAANTLNPHKSF